MPDTFSMLKSQQTWEFKESGSSFLTYGFPCSSQQEFENQLSRIKKEHYNATHHCYAWRIDPFDILEFSQDDGEPSGTAGLPILNQMRSSQLCNSGIVVVRYYGGTKLGKPGLIQAYGRGAEEVIKECGTVGIIPGRTLHVQTPYEHKKQIDYLAGMHDAIVHDATYTAIVTYELRVPLVSFGALHEALAALEYLEITAEKGADVIQAQD